MKSRKIKVRKDFLLNTILRRFCNRNRGYTPRGIKSVRYLNQFVHPNANISIPWEFDPMFSFSASASYVAYPQFTRSSLSDNYINPTFLSRVYKKTEKIYNNLQTLTGIKAFPRLLEQFSFHNFRQGIETEMSEYSTSRLNDVGIVYFREGNYIYVFPFRDRTMEYRMASTELSIGIYYRNGSFFLKKYGGTSFSSASIDKIDFGNANYFWGSATTEIGSDSSICSNNNPCIYLGNADTLSPLLFLYLPLIRKFDCIHGTNQIFASEMSWCDTSVGYRIVEQALSLTYDLLQTHNQAELSPVYSNLDSAMDSYANDYYSGQGIQTSYTCYISQSVLDAQLMYGNVTQVDYWYNGGFVTLYTIINSNISVLQMLMNLDDPTTKADYKAYYVRCYGMRGMPEGLWNCVLSVVDTTYVSATHVDMSTNPLARGSEDATHPYVFPSDIQPLLWKLSIPINQQF